MSTQDKKKKVITHSDGEEKDIIEEKIDSVIESIKDFFSKDNKRKEEKAYQPKENKPVNETLQKFIRIITMILGVLIIFCVVFLSFKMTSNSWEIKNVISSEKIEDIAIIEKNPTEEKFTIYLETDVSNYVVTQESFSFESLIGKLGNLKNTDIYLDNSYFQTNKAINIFYVVENEEDAYVTTLSTSTPTLINVIAITQEDYDKLNDVYYELHYDNLPIVSEDVYKMIEAQ